MAKKILSLVFLFSFVIFHLSFVSPAWADNAVPPGHDANSSWFVQDPAVWQQQTFGTDPTQMDANKYGVFMVTNLAQTVIAALGGVETTVQTPTGMMRQRSGGAIGILANLTGAMYTNPPASSIEYLADVGSNLGLVKPAYAQGFGFSAFSPVLRIWKFFRDIAYLGFVIVFVIVGFMVMFRRKIDPRTVVTIQDALPKIVIALIMVTFSYAIGGLIIDTSEFLTHLVGSTFSSADLIAVTGSPIQKQQTLDALYSANIFPLINALANTDELSKAIAGSGAPLVDISFLGFNLGIITINMIFSVAAIFVMFKIFFALLTPYVEIVLSIIFAPMLILLDAVPGQQSSFGLWLKNLLARALIFPATFAMLAIAAFIKGRAASPWFGPVVNWDVAPGGFKIGWSPATIGSWGGAIGDLIAFGILFTIPTITEAIKTALEIKPQPWEGAAGTEIKGMAHNIPVIGGFISGAMK